MGTKTVISILSAVLFSNAVYASESVSMNDMAKAVELLIVNEKKLKDQLDDNVKHKNLSDTEIEKLSETVKELQTKNIALEKQIDEIKIETMKNSKQINQSVKVANKSVEVTQIDDNKDEKMSWKSQKHQFIVTAFLINVRKWPSANSAIAGVLKQKEVITIDSKIEKDGFLKIKNGWIFKKYLKEVGDKK